MTKEWKVLDVKSSEQIEKELNELTADGWEVEHVISGNSSMAGDEYQRSFKKTPMVFLSRKSNKKGSGKGGKSKAKPKEKSVATASKVPAIKMY